MTPNHLCPEGERLYGEWSRGVKGHAYCDVIYARMKEYFTHKNQCPSCSSPLVLEMYRYKRIQNDTPSP